MLLDAFAIVIFPWYVYHCNNKAFDVVGIFHFPPLARAAELPVTYVPVFYMESHSLTVPKCFLESFGNKTGKGAFTLQAMNTNPCDVSASQRAFGAEESILTA